MALTAAELVKSDHEHLIHPLHHPVDTAEPMIYVRGRGATLTDIGGKEYIDGLAGLWNVNVGHGRAELAEAAAEQIKELAYYSGYAGFSSVPGRQSGQQARAARLSQHAGGVLHVRGRGGQRVRLQDGALLLEGQGQAHQGQDHRPSERLSRRHLADHERHRHARLLEDVRAARARLRPHPDLLSLPIPGGPPRRDRGAGGGPRAGGGHPARGARHGGRLHRRAHPRGRRRHLSDRRLLPARARGVHASTTCSSSPTR